MLPTSCMIANTEQELLMSASATGPEGYNVCVCAGWSPVPFARLHAKNFFTLKRDADLNANMPGPSTYGDDSDSSACYLTPM